MSLRAPILDLLRAPDYRPVNDAALFRSLRLPLKMRSRFLHELRLLLSHGEVVIVQGDRYALPSVGRGRREDGARGRDAGDGERSGGGASGHGASGGSGGGGDGNDAGSGGGGKAGGAREIFRVQRPERPERPGRGALEQSGADRGASGRGLAKQAGQSGQAGRGDHPARGGPAARTAHGHGDHRERGAQASPEPYREGEVAGRIQFRQGGSAFVVPSLDADAEPDARRPDAIQVAAGDTLTALPGDTVVVQIDDTLRGRRFARGDSRNDEPRGRVVRILERARTEVVGRLTRVRSQYIVLADDPRFPLEVFVADPSFSRLQPPPRLDDKVVAALEPWDDPRKPLRGVLTEVLGKTFEPRAELLGVFRKFKLETAFPPEVEREVAGLPDTVPPAQLRGRLDYRTTPVFTIDPDDAKDFDDALSLEPLPHGGLKIGVHIADVSAYVKPGTALDKEALKRGNSTYLVGTVVPMLPEKLSNGLCSLVEAQDRLCKACFLHFDAKGRLLEKETTFADTVIRSFKRLTYKQAYALLFTDSLDEIRRLPLPPKHQTGSTGRALSSLTDAELTDLQGWVRALWRLAARLRRDRMAAGSLDLDMPETKIFVDEQGYADRLERIEHDESHQLIEEFMLAANEAVARLTRREKLPSIYRVHDDPDGEKLDELRQLLATHGIRVGDLSERKELVALLATLATHPQGYTLRTQLLRSLRKAAYRSSPDGHFGLNKKDYTHFTSPIRRYSDLVVHRVLAFYLEKRGGTGGTAATKARAASAATDASATGAAPTDAAPVETTLPAPRAKAKLPYSAAKAEEMGEHLSLTEINSAEAERESVKIKLLEFFERELVKKTPTAFEAVITEVRPNGFFVELTESMTFGFVPVSALQDDYYHATPSGDALVGGKTKRRFAAGAKIEVNIHKVDRVKRLMDFRPVAEKRRP